MVLNILFEFLDLLDISIITLSIVQILTYYNPIIYSIFIMLSFVSILTSFSINYKQIKNYKIGIIFIIGLLEFIFLFASLCFLHETMYELFDTGTSQFFGFMIIFGKPIMLVSILVFQFKKEYLPV